MVEFNAGPPKGFDGHVRFGADLDIRRHPPFFKGGEPTANTIREDGAEPCEKIMLEQRDETMIRPKVIGL
jgi:hypothetical protein